MTASPVASVASTSRGEDGVTKRRHSKRLRIAIVTENFLPKVDGVTRTLAKLLEHIEAEGHEAIVLGPATGVHEYASQPVFGTLGLPLVMYPQLKLNIIRPLFFHRIKEFAPDVIHFVEPVWLGGQFITALQLGICGGLWAKSGIACVTSYHTNLPTYARLFGMPWLEHIMWNWLLHLHNQCQAVFCPSPSTAAILSERGFNNVKVWSRGVDLGVFGPHMRDDKLWAPRGLNKPDTVDVSHLKATRDADPISLLPQSFIVPPPSPDLFPIGVDRGADVLPPSSSLVILYVGRLSWEKNLLLLVSAFEMLPRSLSCKLVFTGHGPARSELESLCKQRGIDALFTGHKSGKDLAITFASADIFAFPSFTETFGQVVLEALTSGLPVVGLDAPGTRDLVSSSSTGLLLPLPPTASSWAEHLATPFSPSFNASARAYSDLLLAVASDHDRRRAMSANAAAEGCSRGSWHAVMEGLIDGYHKAVTEARVCAGKEACRKAVVDSRPASICYYDLILKYCLIALLIWAWSPVGHAVFHHLIAMLSDDR
ncbi:hypothetical protein BDZ97DRAFT_1884915 [Flammula alnicola]|nr:hypothetical protein BDZ97DRAFT_1884915 [Flammula alnicola]